MQHSHYFHTASEYDQKTIQVVKFIQIMHFLSYSFFGMNKIQSIYNKVNTSWGVFVVMIFVYFIF